MSTSSSQPSAAPNAMDPTQSRVSSTTTSKKIAALLGVNSSGSSKGAIRSSKAKRARSSKKASTAFSLSRIKVAELREVAYMIAVLERIKTPDYVADLLEQSPLDVVKEMKRLVAPSKSYYNRITSNDATLARIVETVSDEFKTKRKAQVAKAKDLKGSAALDEFVLFPKLPPELRLRIWKFALPGPRIVEVFQTNPDMHLSNLAVSKASHRSLYWLRQACKDSFDTVSKKYQTIPMQALDPQAPKTKSILLLDFATDSMLFAGRRCGDRVFDIYTHHPSSCPSPALLAKLETIMLPIASDLTHILRNTRYASNAYRAYLTKWLSKLTNLKNIIWMSDDDDVRFSESPLTLHTIDESDAETPQQELSTTWGKVLASSQQSDTLSKIKITFADPVREYKPHLLSKEINRLVAKKGKRIRLQDRYWPHTD